jgi:uncharacterized protein (TIGR00251 family)
MYGGCCPLEAKISEANDRDLAIRVQPGARRDQVVGEREGVLVLKIAAPPVEGAANAALCRFVATVLGLRQGDVTVTRGLTSRHKTIAVAGLAAGEVRRRLLLV